MEINESMMMIHSDTTLAQNVFSPKWLKELNEAGFFRMCEYYVRIPDVDCTVSTPDREFVVTAEVSPKHRYIRYSLPDDPYNETTIDFSKRPFELNLPRNDLNPYQAIMFGKEAAFLIPTAIYNQVVACLKWSELCFLRNRQESKKYCYRVDPNQFPEDYVDTWQRTTLIVPNTTITFFDRNYEQRNVVKGGARFYIMGREEYFDTASVISLGSYHGYDGTICVTVNGESSYNLVDCVNDFLLLGKPGGTSSAFYLFMDCKPHPCIKIESPCMEGIFYLSAWFSTIAGILNPRYFVLPGNTMFLLHPTNISSVDDKPFVDYLYAGQLNGEFLPIGFSLQDYIERDGLKDVPVPTPEPPSQKETEHYFLTNRPIVTRHFESVTIDSLYSLVGLDEVKAEVAKVIGLCLAAVQREAKGLTYHQFSPHMYFAGTRGSGKTTVANCFYKILKDYGLISTGKFVRKDVKDFDIEAYERIGYAGALKAPVRCFGNHLSG